MDNLKDWHDNKDIEGCEDADYNPDIQYERKNPFLGRLQDGYSVVIRYGPKSGRELSTYEEIVDNELERFKLEILGKVKDLPREELDGKLYEIFEAVKNC